MSSTLTAADGGIFIPGEDYRAPDQDERERDRLWPRVWQMACRETDLKSPGDYVNYDILNDSILIIRTGEGADDLSGIYNVCQHRGRRLVDRPRGRLGQEITCRFHGWRFGLDGALKHMAFADDWNNCPDFDPAKLSVPKVRLERWGGWIWLNQSNDAPSLAEWLADVTPTLDPFDFGAMHPVWWKTIYAPVNWKIVVEAFNEGYHAGETHRGGVNYRRLPQPSTIKGPHAMFSSGEAPFSEYRDATGKWVVPKSFTEHLHANYAHLYNTLGAITLEPGMRAVERVHAMDPATSPADVLSAMYAFHMDELEQRGVNLAEKLSMTDWLGAGVDWHLFPNSIVLPSLDGALWYRIRPGKTHDNCIFDIWSFGRFAPGEEPQIEQEMFHDFDSFRGHSPFLEEDFENLEAVNAGVKSRGFRGATTNPVQESIVKHFHDMLNRYCRED